MSVQWPDEPAWNALMTPIVGVVERVLRGEEIRLSWGRPGEPAARAGATVTLDPRLAEGTFHPDDAAWRETADELAPLALDRWRRAAAEILRACLAPDEAAALEAADRLAPELGILWPALADWYRSPEAGMSTPARAAWFVRWGRASDEPTDAEWLAFGEWLFGHAAAEAPLPLRPTSAPPGPWRAAARSFRRVRLEAGAAGATLEGDGTWAPVRLTAGGAATVLVGVREAGEVGVALRPLGPVGTWTLRTGRTGERFGAARNMELTLRADGIGEVTLADAFVGPATPEALSLAEQYGVSGTLRGSWRVVDPEGPVIQIGDITPVGVTVHPRGRFGFAMPAGPFLGRAEGWLKRASGTRWRIRPYEDGIEAVSEDLGREVALVFGRP